MVFCVKELYLLGLYVSERGSKPPGGQTHEGCLCKQCQEGETGSA